MTWSMDSFNMFQATKHQWLLVRLPQARPSCSVCAWHCRLRTEEGRNLLIPLLPAFSGVRGGYIGVPRNSESSQISCDHPICRISERLNHFEHIEPLKAIPPCWRSSCSEAALPFLAAHQTGFGRPCPFAPRTPTAGARQAHSPASPDLQPTSRNWKLRNLPDDNCCNSASGPAHTPKLSSAASRSCHTNTPDSYAHSTNPLVENQTWAFNFPCIWRTLICQANTCQVLMLLMLLMVFIRKRRLKNMSFPTFPPVPSGLAPGSAWIARISSAAARDSPKSWRHRTAAAACPTASGTSRHSCRAMPCHAVAK